MHIQNESSLKSTSISSASKQKQSPFTGYIISVCDKYMKVADAPTKEEALEGNWRDLVDQGKILTVPVPENEIYIIGEKSKCLFHGYDCVTSPHCNYTYN